MNVHMAIETATFKRNGDFNLKPEIEQWLEMNCNSSQFKNWHNVNDHWAIFYFDNEEVSREFLAQFTYWDPSFTWDVKQSEFTGPWIDLDDIYNAFAEQLLWLASQGKIDGKDFTWTVTRLSEEHFNRDIIHTDVLFSFSDKQLAMVFKLLFGGVRVQAA